ncbi:putative repeat protein (TIGR01451 family) [Comamonas sp. 4034]
MLIHTNARLLCLYLLARVCRDARIAASAVALLLLASTVVRAGPVVFPSSTVAVTLDGVPLGTKTSGSGLRNSVVRADDGSYHLWLIKNGADSFISKMIHATSVDGLAFTTQGVLQPPANYWALACGANSIPATEPIATFVRVSKVSGEWLMAVWHQNQAGQNWYSYNTSIWRIGSNPGSLAVTPIGPLPSQTCGTSTGPGRFHIGAFGVEDSFIYLRHVPQAGALPGSRGGNLGRYGVNLAASPPLTTPRPATDAGIPKQTLEADLFAGTVFSEILPLPPGGTRALVYNAGRTLRMGSVLGTYYNFADYNTTAALEKDLWYVESADGGVSWSSPARIYGPGGVNVLVNGLPNGGNFSAPEVTSDGRSYFLTRDACNNSVMVTAPGDSDDPSLSVSMQFSPSSIVAGQTTQWAVTLQGPQGCDPLATTPVITDLAYAHSLPANLQFTGVVVSNSCAGVLNSPAGSSLSLSGVELAAGQSCTTVLEVRGIEPGSYDDRIAAAVVTNAQNLTPVRDAEATLIVSEAPVVRVPQISVAKSRLGAALIPGGSAIYSVTVANTGQTSAGGALLNDAMPAGVESWDWTCAAAGGALCPAPSGVAALNEQVTTFPAGSQLVYTVTARLLPSASGSVTNVAIVTPPAQGGCLGACQAQVTDDVTAHPGDAVPVSSMGQWALMLLSVVLVTFAATCSPGALRRR